MYIYSALSLRDWNIVFHISTDCTAIKGQQEARYRVSILSESKSEPKYWPGLRKRGMSDGARIFRFSARNDPNDWSNVPCLNVTVGPRVLAKDCSRRSILNQMHQITQ